MNIVCLICALTVSVVLLAVSTAYGHGIGYETLPPQMLGDRKVAMEVSSIVENSTNSKQITFSMFDTSTGLTVRDVVYHLKTLKDGHVLFEGEYATSDGVLVISLIPDSSEQILVSKKKEFDIFGFITGKEKSRMEARGSVFASNGLYKFTLDVLSAERYDGKNVKPVRFESGLSFPESAVYELNDLAGHRIKVVSYYDLIYDLRYDAASKQVSFNMPFEWTVDNINQTTHVHEEVFVPKTLTPFQVSKYEIAVNGVPLSEKALTIDDYRNDERIIHILLYQSDLLNLQKTQTTNKMDFVLSAKSASTLLADVTDNVQYRIELTTKPDRLLRGGEATFLFKIYDVFLQGKTISADYEFIIKSNGQAVYNTKGKSDVSKWSEISLTIPHDASDIMVLSFENIGGNGFARAEIPIMLYDALPTPLIPSWIKNNANWWCQKAITDDDFLKGVGYMLSEGVIRVEVTKESSRSEVPDWVRQSSCWWAKGSISDGDFINGISYLVRSGIIVP